MLLFELLDDLVFCDEAVTRRLDDVRLTDEGLLTDVPGLDDVLLDDDDVLGAELLETAGLEGALLLDLYVLFTLTAIVITSFQNYIIF